MDLMRCRPALLIPLLLTVSAILPLPATAERVKAPGSGASVEESRRFFTEDPDAPMIVPKAFDVTIVQYLDYACPACRATAGPLAQLVAKDTKVRVIFRDWPIFGSNSTFAALRAVASKYQGKYVPFHRELYAIEGPLDEAKIRAAANKAGVDWAKLDRDIATHSEDIEDLLARNDEQAQMLGLQGTPGFIIGGTQFFGRMTFEELQKAVAKARTESRQQSRK